MLCELHQYYFYWRETDDCLDGGEADKDIHVASTCYSVENTLDEEHDASVITPMG